MRSRRGTTSCIGHPDEAQPRSVKDGVLAGDLDLLLLAVDEANTAGRNSHALGR